MKLTIESTSIYTTINGQLMRAWEATTENGARALVFISHVSVPQFSDPSEFEAELQERALHYTKGERPPVTPLEVVLQDFARKHAPPKPEWPASIDARLIL